MKQTDAIDKYFEAKESGYSDEQAKLFARSWVESQALHPEAVTKADLKLALDELKLSMMEKLNEKFSMIDAKFVLLTTLGSFIFLVCVVPFVKSFIGH